MYSYTYENLHRITKTEKGKELIDSAKKIYEEKYKDKPLLALKFSLYREFSENGNRANFEKMYFDRRRRLSLLQLFAFSSDEYLSEFEDTLAAICDEYSWVLPAHVSMHPDIDLFSAETSMYLAESAYIFSDKLSPVIRERIKKSVYTKTILPFEEKPCLWETRSSNWSAVCGAGVGLSYLYLFPERFNAVQKRLFDVFRVYLKTISDDGYCEEGIGYWQYGFGFFSIFFDVYTEITETRPPLLDSDKVKNLAKYARRAQMDGGVYLPYADGGTKCFDDDPPVLFAVKNLFSDTFDLDIAKRATHVCEKGRVLAARQLNGIDKYSEPGENEKDSAKSIFYYKDAEVFIYKNESYSFTAKGGHNDELHNHNDVGCFAIVKNQKRLISDIGAGEYTRQYFGTPEERYSYFVCNSFSHSVPIIGGKGQCYGKEYGASDVITEGNRFSLDIAGAYGGGVDSLKLTYLAEEIGVKVKYEFKGLKKKAIVRFVSDFEPTPSREGVSLDIEGLMTVKCAMDIKPTVERVEYRGHTALTDGPSYAYLIDYTLGEDIFDVEFFFEITK